MFAIANLFDLFRCGFCWSLGGVEVAGFVLGVAELSTDWSKHRLLEMDSPQGHNGHSHQSHHGLS